MICNESLCFSPTVLFSSIPYKEVFTKLQGFLPNKRLDDGGLETVVYETVYRPKGVRGKEEKSEEVREITVLFEGL